MPPHASTAPPNPPASKPKVAKVADDGPPDDSKQELMGDAFLQLVTTTKSLRDETVKLYKMARAWSEKHEKLVAEETFLTQVKTPRSSEASRLRAIKDEKEALEKAHLSYLAEATAWIPAAHEAMDESMKKAGENYSESIKFFEKLVTESNEGKRS